MLTSPLVGPGAAAPPSPGPADLLADHAAFVATLDCQPQARRLRRRGGEALLGRHGDLRTWMDRPAVARLVEVRRLGAWPFLSWCFAAGHLVPDLDLLAGKGKGAHYTTWGRLHSDDVARAQAAARELGWCEQWATRVGLNSLALVCLTRAVTLDTLGQDDLDAVGAAIEAAPTLTAVARRHLRSQHYGLTSLCYQLHRVAAPPRHPNRRDRTVADRVAPIPQPEIRRVVLRYLQTIAATVRPKTLAGRAASFEVFTGWLAECYPEVTSLRQLSRAHLEAFLAFDRSRGWRGRVARDQTISVRHHVRTVVDLRGFFDDLAVWGWVDRPTGPVLHRSDIPRLGAALPRALGPDVDAALMAAVEGLDDVAARCALILLRGTGMRLGELMDLELSCLWDLPGNSTWVKVPLGKLDTERVVPLDPATLAAVDTWMAARGRQRALPHPRDGRPTDFLFTIGGHRMGTPESAAAWLPRCSPRG